MSECTIRINPGDPIGPHLADGAVICLAPGVHQGGLTVAHNLELRGEPGAILDGQGRAPVVSVLEHEKQITLNGLTLRGGYGDAGGGLYVDGFSRVTVDNCEFNGNSAMDGGGPGIVATGGLLTIRGSRFSQEDGILFDSLAQVTMENCQVAGDLRVIEGATLNATNSTVSGTMTLRGTTSRKPTVELNNCQVGKIENHPELPASLTVND